MDSCCLCAVSVLVGTQCPQNAGGKARFVPWPEILQMAVTIVNVTLSSLSENFLRDHSLWANQKPEALTYLCLFNCVLVAFAARRPLLNVGTGVVGRSAIIRINLYVPLHWMQ